MTRTVAQSLAELTEIKTDRYYVILNNLFLDIEAGRKPASRRNFFTLSDLVRKTYPSRDEIVIRSYWDSEIEALANENGVWF